MTRNEHLLTILAEECAELAQQVSKALRFGIAEVEPGQTLTNAERIVEEYVDLITTVGLVIFENQPHFNAATDTRITGPALQQKRAKIAEYLEYSRKCGTLTEETTANGPVVTILKEKYDFLVREAAKAAALDPRC